MCGISAIFNKDTEIDISLYYKAHSILAHRGPDDEGFACGTARSSKVHILSGERTSGSSRRYMHLLSDSIKCSWIMGHHRLSIIDLSDLGHQPMTDASERFCLSYNGEIYNYREIREQLIALGYQFHSSSDTEVVLNALIEWGTGAFNRFNGMWAIVLYDVDKREITLARDRFGIKPLYYSIHNQNLYIASEIKFFKPLFRLTLNEKIAADYLANSRTDCNQESFYNEILQVLPAHYMKFDSNLNYSSCTYWSLEHVKESKSNYNESVSFFRNLFDSAIDLRMRSDVPVGSLLSGGLDSTSIVSSLASRDRLPASGFHFYSAVFDDEQFSEKKYIDETQKTYKGLISHFVYPDPQEIQKELDSLIYTQDFPFRSLAVYSQNKLYREVRKTSPVVVLLNGQGGDELFGGYTNHYFSLITSAIISLDIFRANREMRQMQRSRNMSKNKILSIVARQIVSYYLSLFSVRSKRTIEHPVFSRFWTEPVRRFHRDPFNNHLQTNLQESALPEYLRYEDRNSMAYSLESRLPFLDYRIVEWAFSLSDDFKISNGVSKLIVRDAVKPYVPASIVNRTDKMGFVSPQEVWQKTVLKPLVKESVNEIDLDFIDKSRLKLIYSEYIKDKTNDWSFWWRITCMERWLRFQ